MRFDLRRLRAGEWLALLAAGVMALALFALRWYPGRTGWQATSHLRWLLVVTIAVGLALVAAQAALRAPAVPASLDVIAVPVTLVAVLWLLYRVAINASSRQRFGAWLELIAAAGLLAASLLALRQEGTLERDGPGVVPVVELPRS
jgi:hypothetical protein